MAVKTQYLRQLALNIDFNVMPGMHGNRHLQPGDRGAEAQVRPGPKSQVPVGRSIEDAALRVGEGRGVVVGRSKAEGDDAPAAFELQIEVR